MFKNAILLGLAFAGLAAAECPNACSGRGTCCSRDMCTCDVGYTGNDCSLRVCPFGMPHVRTPLGDIDSDNTYDTTEFVTDSYPQGLVERYGSYVADEHPDYTECSSAGICDRESGLCECFPGKSGVACQRASCPGTKGNTCSGHGVCRSMRSMAQQASTRPFTYSFWDQDATMGCDCDAGYSGPSCAERQCEYGVDPLYTSDGVPVYSRFGVRVTGSGPSDRDDGVLSGDFRLRVYDVHGEDYITEPIPVHDEQAKSYDTFQASTACDAIVAAFENLPNGAISAGVTCEVSEVDEMHGALYALTLTGTPGYLKTPTVYESNVIGEDTEITVFPWGAAGEFADRYTTAVTDTNGNMDLWTSTGTTFDADVGGNAAYTVSPNPGAGIALVKVGDEHFVATPVNDAQFTVDHTPKTAKTAEKVFFSADTVAATGDAYVAVGSTNMTVATGGINEGDVLVLQGQRFTALTSGTRITLDHPFGGDENFADVTAESMWLVTESSDTADQYTYVAQCSNRGVCDQDEGLCTCHSGFKGLACDTQVSC